MAAAGLTGLSKAVFSKAPVFAPSARPRFSPLVALSRPPSVHRPTFLVDGRAARSYATRSGPSSSSSSHRTSPRWYLFFLAAGGVMLYKLSSDGSSRRRSPWSDAHLIPSPSEPSESPSSSSQSADEEPQSADSTHPHGRPSNDANDRPPWQESRWAFVRLTGRLYYLVNVWVVEPLGTAKRFVHLVVLFLPLFLALPALLMGERVEVERSEGGTRVLDKGERDKSAGSGKRRRRMRRREEGERSGAIWWYKLLVRQMEKAGPTFIKLAQWAASRHDLFPQMLCDLFGKLHSDGRPHSFGHTKRVLERVFERDFEDIFEEFDREPIGCGAIAQVYKGTLRADLIPPSYLDPKRRPSTGSPTELVAQQLALTSPEDSVQPPVPTASVAIKILHPRVDKVINRDLQIMSFFAHLINALPGMQWISLPEEVDVFGDMMRSQLDLRVEAENLVRFEKNFRDRKTSVSFPRPLRDFSTREMLIEEYEEALPLKAFLKNGAGPYDDKIANMGLDAFLQMLLLDNFTHSDLHPGNIMIKFYRPSTRSVVHDILSSILAHFDSDYHYTQHLTDVDEQADAAVVRRLAPLAKGNSSEWVDELYRLDEAGYLPELVFIDSGLVTQLSDVNRRNFLDLFRAVAEFDGMRAGKLMVERCKTPELVVDEDTFALRMQDLVLSVKSKTFSLAKVKISDVLTDVLLSVRKHHVKMEGDFINTVISILLLEGIGRQFDPNMDLFKSALPILRQLGKQMGGHVKATSPPIDTSELGPMLKFWFWLEAREFISGAIRAKDADAWIRYDWLTPNV